VIQVPKAIVLSVQTTGIANLLAEGEIEGDTALTIGCLYELSRGAQSPWSPYLTFLTKRPPQMATALPKESREKMKLCEAYNDIESDIVSTSKSYRGSMDTNPLLPALPQGLGTNRVHVLFCSAIT